MQNNTDAFSWKRGKRQESEIENEYPSQAIVLSFVFNCLFQRCFKESITALYDHIENVVGTKFQNYHK